MREISMKALKISGQIIPVRTTSSLMRMNIEREADYRSQPPYFLKISVTFLGRIVSSQEKFSSRSISEFILKGGSIVPSGF